MYENIDRIESKLSYNGITDMVKIIGYNPVVYQGCASFPQTTGMMTNNPDYIAMLLLAEHGLCDHLNSFQLPIVLRTLSSEIRQRKNSFSDTGQNDGIRGNITRGCLYRNVFCKFDWHFFYAGRNDDTGSIAVWALSPNTLTEKLLKVDCYGTVSIHIERKVASIENFTLKVTI